MDGMNDVAVILSTSGTTGQSKGMLNFLHTIVFLVIPSSLSLHTFRSLFISRCSNFRN